MKEVLASCHGRVNLIGEHTDYNGGYVLPTCIPQSTQIRLRKREDGRVIIDSDKYKQVVSYTLGDEHRHKNWGDYIQGVTDVLSKEGFEISGFDGHLSSNVPIESGLSSSAALEISLIKGINALCDLRLDGLAMAKVGQKVENDFVGAHVGIMDQIVCAMGKVGEVLFIDTRHLTTKTIPLRPEKMDLLVISSGLTHQHAHGDYNKRRRECEEACKILGVSQLRDVDAAHIKDLNRLPDVLRRRAHHVVTENERVLGAVEALAHDEFERLGMLFTESHRSMRDDYEVSIPEIDLLVEITRKHRGVWGARLTGGGFGGSIVSIMQPGLAQQIAPEIVSEYRQRTGQQARVLVPEPHH